MCLNKQVVPPPIFLPNSKKNNPPKDGVESKNPSGHWISNMVKVANALRKDHPLRFADVDPMW